MASSLRIFHGFTVLLVIILLGLTPSVRALDVDALRGALEDAEVKAVFRDDSSYLNASLACGCLFLSFPARVKDADEMPR